MRSLICLVVGTAFLTLYGLTAVPANVGPRPLSDDPPRKVVIPFDFESKFDDGAYGRTMGDMIWAKLHRQGGFILPESMQDIRDWSQRVKMVPGPDTPMAKMAEIVRKDQAGDIGIWGKVERVAGNE